ncbi:hypothetical protein D3C78_1273820 [compost metagenome]
MRLQLGQLVTVRAVNRNSPPLSNKADNVIARDRLAAAGNVVHQIADALNHYAAIVFAAMWRRVGFLLKLFQRSRILFSRARLIELRLQEIHHLVETNIAPANSRQQLIHFVEVVARQQVFFCFFQVDA